jgi:hypothetical protein
MRRGLAVIAAGLLAFGAAGCATTAQKEAVSAPAAVASEAQVQTLRERAAMYWAARMEGDDKTQWELLEPRGRGRMTPQEYAVDRKGVHYLGYQVEDAAIAGYFAIVKVRVLFQPILPRMTNVSVQTVLLDDQWVRVGGIWYRQMDDRQPQRSEP